MTESEIPLDPGNPETRLLRVIFGYCPDCEHDDTVHHDGDDHGNTHHCYTCESTRPARDRPAEEE